METPDRQEPTEPTQPQSPADPPPPTGGELPPPPPPGGSGASGGDPPPRRLYRSLDDRVLAGVAGGVGRYMGIDPIIVRILTVVATLLGGAGLVAYVAAWLLVPEEPVGGASSVSGASAATTPIAGANRTGIVVVGLVVLFFGWPILLGGGIAAFGLALPLAMLAAVGVFAWLVVSGQRPEGTFADIALKAGLGLGVVTGCTALFIGGGAAAGLGGGTIAAAIVIAAGVVLVVGAFLGRVRWLLAPAFALALGVGVAAASGFSLHGGIGERDYTPATAADLHGRYELGVGALTVDLRSAKLPAGDTPVSLKVGMGAARVIVPKDVCVASMATVGIGGVNVFGREGGGVDYDWDDQRSIRGGARRVLVDADVGIGALAVSHDGRSFDELDDFQLGEENGANAACA